MRPLCMALLAAVVAAGCQDDVQCVCTTVFAQIEVLVLDENGLPATDVDLVVVHARSGDVLQVEQYAGQAGRYTVFDDTLRERVSPGGELLRVSGTHTGRSVPRFDTEYLVRVDAPCGCHVQKVSGPEMVSLAYPPD